MSQLFTVGLLSGPGWLAGGPEGLLHCDVRSASCTYVPPSMEVFVRIGRIVRRSDQPAGHQALLPAVGVGRGEVPRRVREVRTPARPSGANGRRAAITEFPDRAGSELRGTGRSNRSVFALPVSGATPPPLSQLSICRVSREVRVTDGPSGATLCYETPAPGPSVCLRSVVASIIIDGWDVALLTTLASLAGRLVEVVQR